MRHCTWFFALAVSSLAGAQTSSAPAPVPAVPTAVPVPVPYRPATIPASRWTAQQIRQAFDAADADSNGVLTRAEAQQLTILPRTFEDMDENKDGVVSRSEYESAFNR
jgi:Ca2+-binding EF-hand superfamily protein